MAVLQGDRFGEDVDVGLVGQQVEVPVAGEVDLLAVVLGETRVHLEAPQADGDVSGVAEGGPHTAGGLARRSAREFTLLDENDVADPGFGEVERDAGADHAAANDYHGRVLGEIGTHVALCSSSR